MIDGKEEFQSVGGHIFWHFVNYRIEIWKGKNRYLKITKGPDLPEKGIKYIIDNEDGKIKIKFEEKISKQTNK
jgi:hypothetical protein